MSKKRVAKEITDKTIIDTLINLDEDQITTTFMMEMFGDFEGKVKIRPYDTLTVPPKGYGNGEIYNTNSFKTTAGLLVFNKFFFERDLIPIVGYINEPVNEDMYGKISDKLSYAYLEDDIELSQLKRVLNKTQKFMPYITILGEHFSLELLTSSEKINKKKKELEKKYAKEIAAGDGATAQKMEKELIKYAQELLKDDPGSDAFNSGARGSWKNNYKNMFIMKGAIKSTDPNETKYSIITDNYMDGISKESYSALADSLTEGPYARGKKTAIGGYWEKLFVSAFQHVTLDPDPKSDCHTDKYITVTLNNPKLWMYSYIIEGNKLVELTSKNMDKYKGKTVKFRYSSLCKSKKGICNKWAGNFFNRLDMTNIGTATAVIPGTLKLRSMKSFHNSVKKFTTMENYDLEKIFGLK